MKQQSEPLLLKLCCSFLVTMVIAISIGAIPVIIALKAHAPFALEQLYPFYSTPVFLGISGSLFIISLLLGSKTSLTCLCHLFCLESPVQHRITVLLWLGILLIGFVCYSVV